MQTKLCSLLLLVSLAACVDGGAGPDDHDHVVRSSLRTTPREAYLATPVEWSRRDPAAPLWPAGTKRVQVVIAPSWAHGEHLAWFVAEGTRVLQVFRADSRDLRGMFGVVSDNLTLATAQSPTASLWWGGAGTINKPPTPDPGPAPILPPDYVDAVMNVAWDLNANVSTHPSAP